jgi:hypothetical protein
MGKVIAESVIPLPTRYISMATSLQFLHTSCGLGEIFRVYASQLQPRFEEGSAMFRGVNTAFGKPTMYE